jgi:hypothetical protein
MRQPEHKAVAYYEAGRAVVARVLRLPCGPARIAADENWVAEAKIEGPWDTHAEWEMAGAFREVRSACHRIVMSLMAGEEAEIEFLGKRTDQQDLQHVTFILDDLYPEKECFRWEKKLRAKTRRLVQRHRAAIAIIAEMLMQQRMLSMEDIDAIILRMRAVKTAESLRAKLTLSGLGRLFIWWGAVQRRGEGRAASTHRWPFAPN